MGEKRLVFPCGAYFPVKHGDEILDAAHRAKDGAYRIGVYPSSQPHDDMRGHRAFCQFDCPNRRRRKEERGYDTDGRLGIYISCHARLYQVEIRKPFPFPKEYDVTPPRPAKCPHCEEQRTYGKACRRAAKYHEDAPDRTKWRKCPQCEQYRETYEETGMCAGCQLAKVLTDA